MGFIFSKIATFWSLSKSNRQQHKGQTMTANTSKPKRITKIQQVKNRLLAGEVLTVRDIIKMGINRPTDIIWKLRTKNMDIVSLDCKDPVTGEQYVKYLVQETTAWMSQ